MEDFREKIGQEKLSLTYNLKFSTGIDETVFVFCDALEHARISHV